MYDRQHIENNCLKVSGEGTISISPNQVNITIGAITEKKSLQEAQRENAIIISKIITAMAQLGIQRKNIQTVIYRIDTLYDYKDGVQLFRGYSVNHQLQVKIDDIEKTGLVVDHAVNQGANTVSNIEFTVAQPEAYYNEALKLALQNAYIKALTLTSQLAVNLNPIPFKLEELLKRISSPVPYSQTMMATAEATPIQPGEITISATITVDYLYD
ncbi:SIMPL domain-containing protein [Bacillaceae bacterium IKA-2]|nr:SIMPL domain-containing protein [Bacillaceae bacterium IKA-2]